MSFLAFWLLVMKNDINNLHFLLLDSLHKIFAIVSINEAFMYKNMFHKGCVFVEIAVINFGEISRLEITTNKACGNVNICAFFYCSGSNVLSSFLSVYFRFAFKVGVFPQIFKTAQVIHSNSQERSWRHFV